MSQTVCYCKNIDENTIVSAIRAGAKGLNTIKEMTGACTGNRCKELNPKGKCCSADIAAIFARELNQKPAIGCSCCCDNDKE